ncbi:MAG: TonB-dependent receptor [Ferruginibacter sp.]|nr:TonB-dependent receptor [Ferruginibacter sp.]
MLPKLVIKKSVLLLCFLLFTICSFSQKKITGKVLDAQSKPVPATTVTGKGTPISAITSDDGSFLITLPEKTNTLMVSSVGFESREISITGSSNIDIILNTQAANLNEVVVVGYGTQKRKDLTGAISSVSAATIEKLPVISATQALQGRASGVQIMNNDAAPGGNISILIRGIGSLASGGNDPLYVIDGYPTGGGINNINPNDIASIDVLKDASATAVYGIRAANGVVLITTKKGLKNRVQISLDAYNAFQTNPKQYDILNAQDFATLSNQVEASDSSRTYHGLPIWKTPGALHTVDWQDALYRVGLTQNYSVAIRGGSDKAQSAISFGYFDQKGIVLGSFYKRFTIGLNLDYQPTTWLKSATSVKYSYQDANTPLGTSGITGGGGLFQLVVNPPTLDSGNRFTTQIKDANGNYGFYNPINPNVFKFNNPVYSVETNKSKNITHYLLANSSLELTLFDGLKVKTNAGVNVTNFSGSFYQPEDNRAFLQNPTAVPTKAFYRQNLNNNFEWLWENTIAYDKTFGVHAINFVGGISAQKNITNMSGAGGNPPNATIRDIAQLSNLQFDRFGNGQIISTLASQFARLTYQFNDKYILTGTVRRDGSSKFDSSHQYGVFPSGAIAWKLKNESFLQSVNWLSDLKLRGGYGVVGNQGSIPLYQYQALYAGNFAANVNGRDANGNVLDNLGYPFNEIYQNGIAQAQPANPNLKWETDYTTNIGIDAAFLKGALTLTVDWFNRRSKDFLLRIPSSPQTGYNLITRNVGEMNNKGVEVALNYSGKRGKDFQYNVGLTWSAIKNRLVDITSGLDFLLSSNFNFQSALTGQGWADFSQSKIGSQVGDFYGYQSLGIFQTQSQIDALNTKAPGGIYYRAATKPGDRYFADINRDGKVNADDRTSLGSPQPDFFGGLNFDATYKVWDFNVFFYGSYGNKILNYIENNLQSFQKRGSEGVQNVSVEYFNSYWTPTRPSNTFARALANDDNTLNSVPSSAWIENGSYLKLKNLTVGYTLPASISGKFKLSRLRAYISTQNLFTITKYSGLDPEIGIQGSNPIFNGVDNGIYPSSRFFTIGLNVTF